MDTPVEKDAGKTKHIFLDQYTHGDRPTRLGLWLVRAISRKVFEFARISSGGRVLEVGPGYGFFGDVCMEHGLEYVAIEPNERMAAAIEQRGGRVIRATVPPFPKIDGKFDAVVMLSVMEHMNTFQDAVLVTRQVHEMLKPGGTFLVYTPDYLNWRLTFFNCDGSHNYVTTRRRLSQLLVNNGFGDIRSCHLTGPISGFFCFLATAFVSRLPFAVLNSAFPNSKLIYKLYKIQISFLRKVVVVGRKPEDSE